MKTTNFIQAVILMILIALAASCRTSRSHPQDKTVVIVNPSSGNLPPGQAKKIYGDQSAKRHAPGQKKKYGYDSRKAYPLIIIRTPDIVIARSGNGRYYHKNSDGFVYWLEQDNKFYLDEEFIAKTKYNDSEYEDWKQKGHKPDKVSEKENKGNNGKGPKSAGKSH